MTTARIDKVFFFDDSEDEIFLTRMLFEQQEIELDIDHITQIDQLDHHGDSTQRPNAMVVVDLNMPHMHGTEVVKRLRDDARFSDIVVGVCTGSEDPADTKNAREAGADFVVSKPLDIHTLSLICDQVGKVVIDQSPSGTFCLSMKL